MTHSLSDLSELEDSEGAPEFDLEMMMEQILGDPGLTQYVIRRSESNTDTLVGYFRCCLEQNQQRYALHIPVYPAMEFEPQVEAILMDSNDGRVKITESKKFGLRMEIVLPTPAEKQVDFLVEVIATSSPTDSLSD